MGRRFDPDRAHDSEQQADSIAEKISGRKKIIEYFSETEFSCCFLV